MAEKKTLLILRLEGVLQSWGEMSKWDFRDSADFPTKSGIVGLLGCALGLERGDPMLGELNTALKLAVRADRQGTRTVDFQTVTGNPLLNAEGKPKSGGNTIISRRAYLQDACFTAFLDLPEDWQARVANALCEPKWPIFLGRKNCVPSRPVWEAESSDYASLEEAVHLYPAAERVDMPMVYEVEEPSPALGSHLRPDSRLDGGRNFALRRVWRGAVKEEQHDSDEN